MIMYFTGKVTMIAYNTHKNNKNSKSGGEKNLI
jgi:hypothetical protein